MITEKETYETYRKICQDRLQSKDGGCSCKEILNGKEDFSEDVNQEQKCYTDRSWKRKLMVLMFSILLL